MAEISTRRESTRGADYFKLYFKYFSVEPSPITLTIIFIIVNLAIIFESFLLVRPVIYMWILIFALSDPFHKSFLASTEWIDKTIFSNAAAIEGPPGTPLMEHKIAKIHSFETGKTSVQSYLDTFKTYTDNLKKITWMKTCCPKKK